MQPGKHHRHFEPVMHFYKSCLFQNVIIQLDIVWFLLFGFSSICPGYQADPGKARDSQVFQVLVASLT